MSDITPLQIEAAQLRELLADVGDDPVLAPQLRERLSDIELELQSHPSQKGKLFPDIPDSTPKSALFLSGDSVDGVAGIRPSLAAEVMTYFERLFVEQALHEERMVAREKGRSRRRRGSPMPALWLTGTPRGSFGLQFASRDAEGGDARRVHSQTLVQVTNAIGAIGGLETPLEVTLKPLVPKAIGALRRLLKAVVTHGANLRVATSVGPASVLPLSAARDALERLSRDVDQRVADELGTFRGLTKESHQFDLVLASGGKVISGSLSDALDEEDLQRILDLTDSKCVARILTTTVNGPGRQYVTHELLDARPLGEAIPEMPLELWAREEP